MDLLILVNPGKLLGMFSGPALYEMLLHCPTHQGWLHFRDLEKVIAAEKITDLPNALREIEFLVEVGGLFAAGFLCYEAAAAFDPVMRVKHLPPGGLPLLWFGLYRQADWLPTRAVSAVETALPAPWTPDVSQEGYQQAVRQVKAHIARGETYQVNYTYRLRAPIQQQALDHHLVGGCQPFYPLFAALAGAHAPPYAAYLETEDWAIGSLSPELFFSLQGETLTSLPMKGTAPRGLRQADDDALAAWLEASEKNRAENVMIVDMVRNDMGRIARTGSVSVPRLFEVHKFPTVWQMTSTVTSCTSASFFEIFQALFPPASITGAPKIRTMEIIHALESSPRGIYTGAIGYLAPGRAAQFNVAIRTLHLDKCRGIAEYGVGGGIVWDSDPLQEWEETLTKSRPLRELPQPFELLETMRWTPAEGWFLLSGHLGRLQSSANYFDYPLDLDRLHQELSRLAASFQPAPQLVRLKLARDGTFSLHNQPLPAAASNPTRLALARLPVHSQDRFLYHKTTRRGIYQQALAACPGSQDVILWNERGEVTEACIANLVVELDGKWYTPPVSSGLLPGVYRAWMLQLGKVQERIILRDELPGCTRLFLVNSVRGIWQVSLED